MTNVNAIGFPSAWKVSCNAKVNATGFPPVSQYANADVNATGFPPISQYANPNGEVNAMGPCLWQV